LAPLKVRTGGGRRSTRESVLAKISPEPNTGCWLWAGNMWTGDYGRIGFKGRNRLAHRVVYELIRGPIPEGLELDHLCRVHSCVNPDHLEPVTHHENMKRSPLTHRKKAYCPRNHPYEGDNVVVYRSGFRHCRACQRERYSSKRRKAA